MQLTLGLTAQEPARRLLEGEATVFVRHRWARRYILRVLDDGTVRVTLPRWGSKKDATAFVEQSRGWIAKQRRKFEARPAVVHPDESALRKRAAKELPGELLALGRLLGARLDHAELAADPGAAVRPRVRDHSRADAPPRVESLETILEACCRGLSAIPGSPHLAAVGRAAAVHRSGDVLMNPSFRRSCGSLRAWRIAAWIIGALALTAAEARAQTGIGVFNGALTGHVGAIIGGDLSESRSTLGVSVAVHEDNGWGAEIDFGHTADVLAGRQILDVTSYMVNAAFARQDGRLRPFAITGAGVLQVNGCDSPCNIAARTYDLGFNAGGGAFFVLNDYAALRADARYVFSGADHPELNRPNNFAYWRLSFGATYRWAIAP